MYIERQQKGITLLKGKFLVYFKKYIIDFDNNIFVCKIHSFFKQLQSRGKQKPWSAFFNKV